MAKLPETAAWESEIHQLEESERAKAGPGGILNLQASQLANRTRFLKENLESIPDYREFTFYKTETDPDGTIAGLAATENGQLFRVMQGIDNENSFIYYENRNGVAEPGAAWPGTEAVNEVKRNFQILPDGTFAILGENGIVFAIDPTALAHMVSLAVQNLISVGDASFQIYQNANGLYVLGDNGIPLALGPDGVLRLVAANIGGAGFESESSGIPVLFRGTNGVVGAVDTDGNLRFPGVITDKLTVGGEEVSDGRGAGFASGDRYLDSGGNLAPVLPDSLKMSAWGSSSLVRYDAPLAFSAMAAELGVIDWNNQGQGGESSFQIAARFGSVPFSLVFPGNTIPASGAVNVACTQLPSNFRNSFLKSFSGTVGGVAGTLSWSSNSLLFTRDSAGASVSLTGATDFIPTLPESYRDGVVLLWMYKNDITYGSGNPEVNAETTFNNVVKTFAHVSSFAKRCLVIGIFNDSSYSNTDYLNRVATLNSMMRQKFGDLYCDTQDYICSEKIWTDTGITPTQQDLTQQAGGYKATSLSGDALHLNYAASKAITDNVIKPKLISLGWYK